MGFFYSNKSKHNLLFTRSIILTLNLLFCVHVQAQLSEKNQRRLDTLYPIALDTSISLNKRIKAYKGCCWVTAHQDYNLSLQLSKEYLTLAKTQQNYDAISQALHYIGHSQLMLGNIEASNSSYQEGLKTAIKYNNFKRIVEANGNLGNLNNTIGQRNKAIDYHLKSLDIAQQHDIKVAQARAKINLGEIYEIQGNYKSSLTAFEDALIICKKNSFSGYKSSIYESLGNIHLAIKEYNTAQRNYQTALYFAKRFNNNNRKIRSLRKLGQLYNELDSLKIAEKYFRKALKYATDKKTPLHEAQLMSDLAHNALKENRFQKALKHSIKSISIFEKHDIKENRDKAYLIAAQIHEQLNNKTLQKKYLQQSYDLAIVNQNISILKLTSKGLADISQKNRNWKLASKYFKEYIAYSSKKRNENEVKEVLRIQLKNDYKNKAIADSLKKANELNLIKAQHQTKVTKTKLQTYYAYSGIIVLCLVLLFVIYFFNQKRKTAVIFAKKNKIISQALKDKEILLKEVHHRVKNNMQVVSSILQLKSVNTKDPIAKAALLDSQKRIDSMQLAHQKMYQKGNYEEICIHDYCNDLVTLLLQPIATTHDVFEVKGKSLWLHVEQAQTLGFIIHELITNSLKYAWQADEPKHIMISCVQNNNNIHFEYSDNGLGMPKDFNLETANSFGMKMIHALSVRQLLGNITVENTSGITVKINFNARS